MATPGSTPGSRATALVRDLCMSVYTQVRINVIMIMIIISTVRQSIPPTPPGYPSNPNYSTTVLHPSRMEFFSSAVPAYTCIQHVDKNFCLTSDNQHHQHHDYPLHNECLQSQRPLAFNTSTKTLTGFGPASSAERYLKVSIIFIIIHVSIACFFIHPKCDSHSGSLLQYNMINTHAT